MESLLCKTDKDLMSILSLDKPFQARIIRDNLIKGVTSFDEMTSLPKALRERLSKERGSALTGRIIRKEEADSTVKIAVSFPDGAIIECVRLSDGAGRYTACLSSQVGCAMGCAFCKTGTMGLIRNLTAGEIVEEFILLSSLGERISHIVFMGMGEALHNFTASIDAAMELHRESGFDISFRKMTISTCGLVPGIKGKTENITVTSIVGRFLEHSRIYIFGNGDNSRIYISSADIMTRNQSRRVEIGCPVYDPDIKKFILEYTDLLIRDNVKSRILLPDGNYVKPVVIEGDALLDAQRHYIDEPPVISMPPEEKKTLADIIRGLFRK